MYGTSSSVSQQLQCRTSLNNCPQSFRTARPPFPKIYTGLRTTAALQGSLAEHAQDHGDLAGVVDGMLHDSLEHCFVGIAAAGNLFRQIVDGKIAKLLFEQVAALVPAGDELVPGNGRLGPFLFGLPAGERVAVGGVARPFVPKGLRVMVC